MKRTLIALAAGALLLTGCFSDGNPQPAAPEPELTGDARFVQEIRGMGTGQDHSDAEIVEAAQVTCDAADVIPGPAFAAKLLQESPRFDFEGREFAFSEAAIAEYCPEAQETADSSEQRDREQRFRASLISGGLPQVAQLSAEYIDLAGQLCSTLDRGVSVQALVDATTGQYPKDQAAALVSASVANYCGDYTSEVIEYVVANP